MKYNIVTIEREYASGGREIGYRTAEKLGIPYYGKEILEMAAKKKGVSPEYLEELEETPTNSFFYSVYMLSKNLIGDTPSLPENDALRLAEAEIINDLAAEGSCVIIGRCACHALRRRKDVLNVFIHSSWEARVKRAVETYGVDAANAEVVLKKFDKRRACYYNANTGKKWSDPEGYHMILDSDRLGIGKCVDILEKAVE
ncbi:AAA family ATPase [Eubacterium limosum]|uniref:cytidylate kinase-like family protein n=1 Tax=Eubacterium limosum TaxID=1736 RepID=UPI0037171CF5